MPQVTLRAVVLRRAAFGESDRWLTLFSREQGRVEAIAKGARKGGSRLAAVSEPLICAEFHLALGRQRRYVTQAQPVSSFPGIREDYVRLSFALALAEAYAAVCQPSNPDPEAFDLLLVSLRTLEAHERPVVAFVWGELKLLEAEGVAPDWLKCSIDGARLTEDAVWLSPAAGGYVSRSHATEFSDRFRVPAEVAIGLAKTAMLDAAPPRLRHEAECLRTLYPFVRHMAHAPLPAHEAALRSLDHPS